MNDSELSGSFRTHARIALPRAPLHSALCTAIASDPAMSSLLAHAPETQRTPVLPLAAIHSLILADPSTELAAWYPTVAPRPRDSEDPALRAAVKRFIDDHAQELRHLISSRQVQTNEVGRCASLMPAFALLADEVGALAHIDVGTSAGLTTLLPHFTYRYNDGPGIGTGTPVIECAARNDPPIPSQLPHIATSIGIDAAPLDATDLDDARWLQACVWPDQVDRFERLASALEIARASPPKIREGDAVELIRPTIADVAGIAHPVVTTTWVMNYLTSEQRRAFMLALEQAAATTDLSWVFAESPAQTPELPHAADLATHHITALSLVTWRGGIRSVRNLATAHPHGYWLHWR